MIYVFGTNNLPLRVWEKKAKVSHQQFLMVLKIITAFYSFFQMDQEINFLPFLIARKDQQNIKYPKIYYRKKKQVYVGDYVPPSSADIAGFNTNGKSRGTILAKLEEVLRNRQLISYSSRFYEELKVFRHLLQQRVVLRREMAELLPLIFVESCFAIGMKFDLDFVLEFGFK